MEERYIHAATGGSLREVVNFINKEGLSKEDLWFIDKERGQYTLLYFKNKDQNNLNSNTK